MGGSPPSSGPGWVDALYRRGMGNAPRWDDVRQMSDDELRRRYDAAAQGTVVGTSFWREELLFRAQMRAASEAQDLNAEVAKLTRSIEGMTRSLVVLTVLAVIVGIIAVIIAAEST